MKRTGDVLRQVGMALYGDQWQGPLGRALNVGDRTMRDWAHPDAEFPAGVVDELVELCTERGNALLKLAADLPEGRVEGITGRLEGGVQTQVYSHMRRPGEKRKL
jgi:hypothetical protein